MIPIMILRKIGSFLAGLPVLFWLCLIVLFGWHLTANKLQDAQQLAADRLVVIQKHEAEAKTKSDAVATETKVEVIRYRDRIQYIKGEARVIEKQVPIYIPAGTPDLPGGFRLLHDAAAQGRAVTGDASGHEAAAVAVEDAARTVAENYANCLADKERLSFYQGRWQQLEELYGTMEVD